MNDLAAPTGARRPGGRTARVRADVHAALDELLQEDSAADITIAKVATRSGVHIGTLYRRWGTLDGILLDVLSERLADRSPMPDTGTLRGDLQRYAEQVSADLSGPDGLLFLRALITVRMNDEESPAPAIAQRFEDLQSVLDRAAQRGEPVLDAQAVFELLVAPLIAGLLFGAEDPDVSASVSRLVDRIETLADSERGAASWAQDGAVPPRPVVER
ncbi:TetR-like C-terminal domain-containing protein [Microbacterium ureisolvens]|uniref:TetR/AcrR family transcriptional regulator C-terminal ligand-binding domain-containing protein n=1 Tax=Microbacterium ureisolvens TaxID=2781186 RepID=A0ABS7I1N7_9MICO|nr:TetR-like C-terminal domain-containing protein [Microbacterium ureisolvens]MBW9110670.1 TetR/AcrR family transcriptional regulator C-terminal ligand-binding domain-containing protein [Microbacterium ureisolvens]